jgi:hypothetical protein
MWPRPNSPAAVGERDLGPGQGSSEREHRLRGGDAGLPEILRNHVLQAAEIVVLKSARLTRTAVLAEQRKAAVSPADIAEENVVGHAC